MKRFLLAILLAVPPVLAFATYTSIPSNGNKDVVIAFTTGTEAAPTTDATLGLRLDGLGGFSVHAEAATNMTAGGVFQAYLYNDLTGNWTRVADGSLDLTVSAAATKQSWYGFKVVSDVNRIMWIASGVGVASTLYVIASQK